MNLPARIAIREVGPRDGLQAEMPVPVEGRVRLIEAAVAAGVREVEAVSFVSPKAVPSMAGAAEVMGSLDRVDGVRYLALVPNVRGADMALDARVDGLTVTISVSPAYNEKNVRMTVDESVDEIGRICSVASSGGGVAVDAVISCAFGSPYEGDVDPSEVAKLGARLMDAGCAGLVLADTTGMATPRRIEEVVALTGTRVGLHLHDTRGTALVNAYAAVQLGVPHFDASVGGLGGSPFAAGAAGNLATEEFVYLLDDLGVESGVSLDGLLEAAAVAESLVGHPLPSRVAKAGPRTRLAGG